MSVTEGSFCFQNPFILIIASASTDYRLFRTHDYKSERAGYQQRV
jgi:hypothetical protein